MGAGMSDEGEAVSIGVVVAVDTGGTFTDVVVAREGGLFVVKVPSTRDDPARAVLEGLRRALGEDVAAVLVHGSTVATNALLERRGARVTLVTNAGFEDVLAIGRQNRPQLYALTGTRPPPLVPAERRLGLAGRLGPLGEEVEPLDEAELAALGDRVSDCDAIAVCLLHSYANPAHERRVAAALASAGRPISVSSALLPEYREYERTATTVVNAYLAPLMDRYLARIEAESGAERVRIMGSGGGSLPVERARREPVHTVLSGPAGGVMGALETARRAGFDNVIGFDMGGTSTDVSLCPGRPLHTRELLIAGLPVAVAVLDIHTVGAGGGSIARLDAAGALRVGPESAGAEPGPVCYGRGGRELTVTDANVWLGRLPAEGWAHGGEGGVTLARDAVAGPLEELAAAMHTTTDAAAEGILAVVDTAMEGALRVISVERGHDPADFTLVAFGGAAGLHAASLAQRLGVPRVLIPPSPGVLSAFGMLVAPIRRAASRTVFRSGHADSDFDLAGIFDELEQEAAGGLARELGTASREAIDVHRTIDARYRGQSYELTVAADGWVDGFHAAHRARYGYASPDAEVEAVTLRVEALAPGVTVGPAPLATTRAPTAASVGEVFADGRWVPAPRHSRDALPPGHVMAGPAIVTEYSATAWLPRGWTAEVLAGGSILLRTEGAT